MFETFLLLITNVINNLCQVDLDSQSGRHDLKYMDYVLT